MLVHDAQLDQRLAHDPARSPTSRTGPLPPDHSRRKRRPRPQITLRTLIAITVAVALLLSIAHDRYRKSVALEKLVTRQLAGTISFPQEPIPGVPLLRVLYGASKIDLPERAKLSAHEARLLAVAECPFRSLRCHPQDRTTLMILARVKPLRQLILTPDPYYLCLPVSRSDVETFSRARPDVTVEDEIPVCELWDEHVCWSENSE